MWLGFRSNQGRNHGKTLGATSAMVARICPPPLVAIGLRYLKMTRLSIGWQNQTYVSIHLPYLPLFVKVENFAEGFMDQEYVSLGFDLDLGMGSRTSCNGTNLDGSTECLLWHFTSFSSFFPWKWYAEEHLEILLEVEAWENCSDLLLGYGGFSAKFHDLCFYIH